LLIDDGSTDGTDEMVKAKVKNLSVIKGKGDWWWAGSLQQGIFWLKKHGSADSLVLSINDDVCFEPVYLEKACQVMENKKKVLMLSRNKYQNRIEIHETGVHANLRGLTFKVTKNPEMINCLSTKGLFLHYADLLAIGDFYPVLLPHYLSDYEFTIRAYKKGFKCETSADLLIEPNEETTGYHKINEKSFLDFLKKFFSKKSASNPLYWCSFSMLVSEPLWIVPNLMIIWVRTLRTILMASLTAIKLHIT
jgi:GT2 family glycosyltransferase